MIKNIIRFFSVLVILVILISTLLTTWTSYVFLSNNSKRSEIKNLIGEIYISQKSILFNFIDLSKILVKNEEPFKDDSIIIEQEIENLLPDSLNDEISTIDQTKDNPLGIVIIPHDDYINEEVNDQLDQSIEDSLIDGEYISKSNE